MEVLIAFGGVLLGWLLGAATEVWRDRRRAIVALMLIHNELLANIAQLDLARRWGSDEAPRPSHWYRRWKLSRSAWEQQGAHAVLRLDGDDAWKVYSAYHALDASQLLLDEAREGVIALGKAVGNFADPDGPEVSPVGAAEFVAADAKSREMLGIQVDALHAAHEVLDRHLGLSHRG